MPRRLLHWDEQAVVLFGGARAERFEAPNRCGAGLRAIVLTWEEVRRIRLVEPYGSVEIESRFENVLQREVVRAPRPALLEPFASLVLDFVAAAQLHRPQALREGWDQHAAVPWEPTAGMPTDPLDSPGGAYRAPLRPELVVAARTGARLGERVRRILRSDSVERKTEEGSFEHLLAQQSLPWAVYGDEVAVTHDHVYARSPRGPMRIALDTLRRRIDLPQLRLYLFGRRSLLLLAGRTRCVVQEALDARLTHRAFSPVAVAAKIL
jgi:hypothetical protein